MIWYVPDLHSRLVHIETWHMSGWLGMEQLVMRLGEEGRDIMWIWNMQHIITRSLSPGAPPTLTNIHKHNRQYYSRSSSLTDTHKMWRSSTCGLHPYYSRSSRSSTSSHAPSFCMMWCKVLLLLSMREGCFTLSKPWRVSCEPIKAWTREFA